MQENGFAVHAASSPGYLLDDFAGRYDVPVFGVPMARKITPLRDLVSIWRLWRIMRRIKPQVVHASTPKGGLLGAIAARLARVPVVIYHIRGLPFQPRSGWRRRILKLSEWMACKAAHDVFCVSHSIRLVAIEEKLAPADKIQVFLGGSSNGVDSSGRYCPENYPADARQRTREELGIPLDATVIGFIGRVVCDKGIRELEQAWQSLREEFADAHLFLGGPVEDKDAVPAEVMKRLRADPKVHWSDGYVVDVSHFYTAFDLVVLPTYREGLPNAVIEGGAMRLPVVATDIPGCTDALEDGVAGTLVPAGEAEPLRAALAAYLADPEMRRRHGLAGRARVERDFQQERLWRKVLERYLLLMKRSGRVPDLD